MPKCLSLSMKLALIYDLLSFPVCQQTKNPQMVTTASPACHFLKVLPKLKFRKSLRKSSSNPSLNQLPKYTED
jgi:hypothetical protein